LVNVFVRSNGGHDGDHLYLDNIHVTSTLIPEPGTALLALLAGLVVPRWRRR
jgi:hypothetical protein